MFNQFSKDLHDFIWHNGFEFAIVNFSKIDHISSSFSKFSLGETWSLGWHSSAKIDLLDNVNELVQHFFVNMPKPQQTKPWYAFDGRRRFISVAATLPRKISKVFFVSFTRPECNQIWFLKEAASSIIIFSVSEVMALFSHRC